MTGTFPASRTDTSRLTTAALFGWVITVAIFLAVAGSARAADIASAERFVRQLYAGYVPGPPGRAPDPLGRGASRIFEPSLLALIRRDAQIARQHGDAPMLDGDPICDCQDWNRIQITQLVVDPSGPDQAVATTTITDTAREAPETIRFDLVSVGGQWRVRDIHSTATPSLREFLSAGLSRATRR